LTWITPSGINITQNYLKSKTTKLGIKLFGIKKTIILRESSEDTNKIKQINAIIPNIVHSMDAAHLMNVINAVKLKNIGPVITVHDCFGTLPNQMGALQHEVKIEFIALYTQHDFLGTFHNRLIQAIRDNNLEILEIDGVPRFVLLEDEQIEIPQLPEKGALNLDDIRNSTYAFS
jgi:DNA-directed RNA polymerase, mitochondrial